MRPALRPVKPCSWMAAFISSRLVTPPILGIRVLFHQSIATCLCAMQAEPSIVGLMRTRLEFCPQFCALFPHRVLIYLCSEAFGRSGHTPDGDSTAAIDS
ncbi:hypothetical protein JB92DRAFT_2893072 [Gautieria morchelliformis]|nr:hypothetical protein JB92DRAFT_2893072 [Gautieria morchelliformis]